MLTMNAGPEKHVTSSPSFSFSIGAHFARAVYFESYLLAKLYLIDLLFIIGCDIQSAMFNANFALLTCYS